MSAKIHHRFTDLSLCHPVFSAKAIPLANYLISAYETGMTQTRFEPFETIRLAGRQNEVFAKGSSKARPWQSAHNFGLACDFVPRGIRKPTGFLRGWSWDDSADWSFLKTAALKFGLECPISWDRAHVEAPEWERWKTTIMA